MNIPRRTLFLTALTALVAPAITCASVITSDPSLPPNTGVYMSPAQVHATYSGPGLQIVLSNIQHQPFAGTTVRTPSGADEIEDFNSSVTGDVSVNGSPTQGITGTGPVRTLVLGKIGNTTGTFQTEMLSLDLSANSGFGPFMIRESPTRASLGQTSITDIGGGLYRIDSFFDVFTELSIDGGQSWIPSDNSTHVDLQTPAPGAAALLGVGLAVSARRRRH